MNEALWKDHKIGQTDVPVKTCLKSGQICGRVRRQTAELCHADTEHRTVSLVSHVK
jgi:hypothetical protein